MRVFRVKDICLRTQRKLGFKTGPILVLIYRFLSWHSRPLASRLSFGVAWGIRPPASYIREWAFSVYASSAISSPHRRTLRARVFLESWGAARHDRASSATVEHPARHLFRTCVSPNRIHIFPHDARSTRAQRGSGYNVCFNLGRAF